jgi:hypothetical protein
MRGRYVLTSLCLSTGTIFLTQTLRQHLRGRDLIHLVDEDGETYEARIDWNSGRLLGLAPYYEKRRLGVNEAIEFFLEGEALHLQTLAQLAPRKSPPPPPPPPPPEPARVRVSPYPKEILYPQVPPPAELPGFIKDLEALGFTLEAGGPPWQLQASLGRRALSLALARWGELDPEALLELRRQGRVRFAGVVLGESLYRSEPPKLPAGLQVITSEALREMVKLRRYFPVGPLDLERLLKAPLVDLESVRSLEGELSGLLGERAAFSAILMLLAEMSPQKVFLFAELLPSALELGLDNATLTQALEVLSGPPFLLLQRLAPGEYLLRQSVGDALRDWEAYAQALSARIVTLSQV